MSFLLLIVVGSVLAWAVRWLVGERPGLRWAMRWGMGLGFVFTGVDHFVNSQLRYVPMIPDLLSAQALSWVYLTGMAELAGGLALLVPQPLLVRLRVQALHKLAGLGLAVLLVCVVVANVHVARQGQQVHGLPFGAWYYWVRPLLQPVFILWALYCSGVWAGFARRSAAAGGGR